MFLILRTGMYEINPEALGSVSWCNKCWMRWVNVNEAWGDGVQGHRQSTINTWAINQRGFPAAFWQMMAAKVARRKKKKTAPGKKIRSRAGFKLGWKIRYCVSEDENTHSVDYNYAAIISDPHKVCYYLDYYPSSLDATIMEWFYRRDIAGLELN